MKFGESQFVHSTRPKAEQLVAKGEWACTRFIGQKGKSSTFISALVGELAGRSNFL
jgi:hypothetical protein